MCYIGTANWNWKFIHSAMVIPPLGELHLTNHTEEEIKGKG